MRIICIIVVAGTAALARAQSAESGSRRPVPAAPVRERIEKQLRGLFKDDYARRDRIGRRELAAKLIGLAGEARSEPDERYVLLCEARDSAARAGDVRTLLQAVERLEEAYDLKTGLKVSSSRMKLESLDDCKRAVAARTDLPLLASAYLETAEGAVKSGDHAAALAAAREAKRMAGVLRDRVIGAQAAVLVREIPELRREAAQVARIDLGGAIDLGKHAENLNAGRYLSFVKGDWERGLEYLLYAGNPALARAARMEFEPPEKPAARADLGDAWRDLGEGERNPLHRRRYQGHAAYWYRRALDDAGGLLRARVEKSLGGLDGITPGAVNLLGWIDPETHSVKGKWRFKGSVLHAPKEDEARVLIPCMPPDEYDLRIVASLQDDDRELVIGLVVGGRQVIVELRPDRAELELIDGERGKENGTRVREPIFTDDRPRAIVCSVRHGRVRVAVDGKPLIDFRGAASRLSLDDTWRVPETRALFVGADDTVYHLHEVTLVSISGTPKRLR